MYVIKFESLKETDEFPNSLKPPKLNQEEISSLSRPTSNTEIETLIQSLLPKCPGPQQNSIRHSKKIYNEHYLNYSRCQKQREDFQTPSMMPVLL